MADTSLSPSSAGHFVSHSPQDAEEGSPVVTVIMKRLRAAKKRLGKIELIEAKPQERVNREQEESLKSKPKTLATIEELEKLLPLLEIAKEDEVKAAVNKAVDKTSAGGQASATEGSTLHSRSSAANQQLDHTAIFSVLKLLYFSQTFELERMSGSMAKLERDACLSYYKYQAPDQRQPLTDADLQLICKLGGLMLMRRTDEPVSHEEALQEALGLAVAWLQRSDEPIPSIDGASMERISSIVDRATSTTYMSVRPVLSTAVSEGPNGAAQAASGDEHQSYNAQQQFQGPPMTPEESYEPPADPSPTSQPPSQESSLSHYPDTAHSHAPIYSQEYGDHQVGYQTQHPGMQTSHQDHSEPYLDYAYNGSVKSDNHDGGALQHDMYSQSQRPQGHASGSLDGSQINGHSTTQNAYDYSEQRSGSLDGSNGPPVRRRSEASRPSNLIYRGGYRGKGAPIQNDGQPLGYPGESQGYRGDGPPRGYRGRGRGEPRGRGRGEYGRGRGATERAPRGRGEGRSSRGRGAPRYHDESQSYETSA